MDTKKMTIEELLEQVELYTMTIHGCIRGKRNARLTRREAEEGALDAFLCTEEIQRRFGFKTE